MDRTARTALRPAAALLLALTGTGQVPDDYDGPVPTPIQLGWQAAELGVLVSYELHTFGEVHYVQRDARVTPIDDVDRFAPELLDTEQWVRAAKAAGARFAILTASHESSFRLSQSDANPYCLKAVSWAESKRDVVSEFHAACVKHGVLPGMDHALTLERAGEVTTVMLQEDIRHDERVRAYEQQAREAGTWRTLVDGTRIGHKRIPRFDPPEASDALRVVVRASNGTSVLARFGAWAAGGWSVRSGVALRALPGPIPPEDPRTANPAGGFCITSGRKPWTCRPAPPTTRSDLWITVPW